MPISTLPKNINQQLSYPKTNRFEIILQGHYKTDGYN